MLCPKCNIGHSTGLAARMQTLEPIGSIAATSRRKGCAKDTSRSNRWVRPRSRGVSEPVAVFEVIGLGALRMRLQVAAQRGLTKFVGRQAELEQMKHALELLCEGHGQIVAVMGEPGVGKSWLFFEFKAVAQGGAKRASLAGRNAYLLRHLPRWPASRYLKPVHTGFRTPYIPTVLTDIGVG
jgi:hypothetical protein